MAYLREKNNLVQKWKMEEMQLQKQQLEAESKKKEQSKKQHKDLMLVMLQQTKQQQEQMQNFQKWFMLMQQQQSQIIIKLLDKTKLSHSLTFSNCLNWKIYCDDHISLFCCVQDECSFQQFQAYVC